LQSAWIAKGTWLVPGVNHAPAVVSVTPSSVSGLAQTFNFVFSDPDGYQSLAWCVLKDAIFSRVKDPSG